MKVGDEGRGNSVKPSKAEEEVEGKPRREEGTQVETRCKPSTPIKTRYGAECEDGQEDGREE